MLEKFQVNITYGQHGDQPPRGSDDDARAMTQRFNLQILTRPAHDDSSFGKKARRDVAINFFHLQRKLACRQKNQDRRMPRSFVRLSAQRRMRVRIHRTRTRLVHQPLHNRQQERERLAGARLRSREHIFAREPVRDRRRLNGSRRNKAERVQLPLERG